MNSPWVNWNEFAALNESETQRIASEAQQAQDAQRRQYEAALGNLESEARATGEAGHFGGVEKLGSYQQLMRLQQEQQGRQQPGALARAPWESLLGGGQQQQMADPWASLSKRLSEAGRTGQQAQRGYAQRQAEHQQYLDRQAAKQKDQSRPLTPAEEYARWSNAVQAAGTGGRAGAAAYYGNTKPPR